MVLDALAKKIGIVFESKRYADKSEFRFKGRTFILIKPTTYMNLSGKAIVYWLQKEKISDENLLVIADDIALPLGTLRMRKKGGAGGHNGLQDIIDQLGSENFTRLRIGAGNGFPVGHQVRYVLGEWTEEEKKVLDVKIEIAIEAIKNFGTIGVDLTMNSCNKQ